MKKNLQYALLSAVLLWLAWPPLPFASPLLLIGLFPLLAAVENIHQSALTQKGKKVFLTAGLTFFVWNTASIYWIWNASPEGAIVAYILGALLMTLSFFLYYQFKKIVHPILADVFLLGFWISYEYLHQTWDLNFPWMTLGNGFASTPHLIQWYSITGVYGGTLWILVSNLLLLNIWRYFKTPKNTKRLPYKLLFVLGVWILVPMVYSILVYTNYEEEINPANIVVVQPNIDPYQKYGLSIKETLDSLIDLSQKATKQNTEFIIWPETAIPEYLEENSIGGSRIHEELQKTLINHPNATLITGAETYLNYNFEKTLSAKFDKNSGQYWDSFNTALAIESSPKVQIYHKSKLVPGVEKMPFTSALAFLKPVFAKFGGTTGGYGYQAEPSVLYSQNGVGVAPVICYESIWGDWVTGYVKKGAQFIAIITNDGWWGNTSGKDQHLDYACLRAIETRRWVARSANTGISAFINQRGDIVQQTTWWKSATLNQDINLNSELTFYVQHPDVVTYPFLLLGFIGLLYVIFYSIIKKKKRQELA